MRIEQMETDRLIIRSTTESDGNSCLDIWLDDEMGKYLVDPPRDKADDATLNFAVNIEQDEGWYPMVVIHKATNEFLGTCSIVPSDNGRVWDLGYAVHKRFWRQGYAAEFLSKLIEVGKHKGISAFTVVTAKDNIPSCKLLAKLGFKIIKDTGSYRKRGTDIIYEEYTFELKNRPTVYEVKTAELNTMQNYMFAVIFARYKDKWIFCRHKERTTYETPGGRIEQGESCLQAAKRELYEETGAIDFEITPMFDYSVNSSRGLSNGEVYFAEVKELGKLPESEIAFIEFFDDIPSVLTYPDIQPILFGKVKDLIKSCKTMNHHNINIEYHHNINIEYRLADKSDIKTVTVLLCELYHAEHNELIAENEKLFADAKQAFFLAFADGKPVGVAHCALRNEYVNGTELGGTIGYLEGIYVKPEYRLNGIAASLVARCEAWAKSNGCREFASDCLIDNMESYKFHLALGFIETERCIFFRKEL